MTTPLLELSGVTKRFPGVVANDGVTFSVGAKEIHALLGENGAGKSTLVKMIYGVMRPDEGTMRLSGADFAPTKPSDARARGVGMVFQHFSLFEGLTVAENIALGISPQLAKAGLDTRIREVSASYGLKVDPDRRVGSLSVGERQRVEIVRCLLQGPRLLIMDEPTSVLTPQEIDVLFATLRRLVSEGCSILYISHKLEEIRALCHKATILRGGKVVGSCDPTAESARSLAEMMIGTTLSSPQREPVAAGPVRLTLKRLTLPSHEQFGVDLADIDLEVRGGEIVGVAGVAGNGQVELMEALIGEQPVASDAILLDGAAVGDKTPTARRAGGMCFVPEERLGHGAVPDMALWENAVLTARGRRGLVRSGLVDIAQSKSFAENVVAEFGVRTAGIGHAARSLSGGNLQKFVMGREILQAPNVLVVSQPTWGVDAGAAATIHKALLALAKAGAAILVISQDLDELFAISDRIAVIAGGRLTAAQPVETLTVEAIGLSMGGSSTGQRAEAAHA